MPQQVPVLSVKDISLSLGGKEILQSVSLDLLKGDLKILIGPSGSGKSTLLQCMNFLHTPNQGRVFLDGQQVKISNKKDLYAFRQQVGMIFQDFNLFDHLNALDNVSIALRKVKKWSKKKARERAFEELDRVGLKSRAGLYPAELSGGQKQRVSIARALAMDPQVILLDEPTSALDPELIGEVLTVIRDLSSAGMTMIMATHQVNFIQSVASEVLFMEKGKIIEQGPPSDLIGSRYNSRCQAFCAKLSELSDGESS